MTNLLPIITLSATAGVLAFFSPCGYALLPAYIGFFLSRQGENPSRKKLAGQGLAFGFFVVLGFITVLALLWLTVALLGNILGTFLPKLALAIGIVLALVGVYLFFKPTKLSIPLPKFLNRSRNGYLGAYFFGLAYIIGGIGCTLPIFLAVLAGAALLGPLPSLLTFAAFSGSMSLLLLVITGLLVLARQALFDKLKKILPFIQKAGAVLLVIAGIYLIITEL